MPTARPHPRPGGDGCRSGDAPWTCACVALGWAVGRRRSRQVGSTAAGCRRARFRDQNPNSPEIDALSEEGAARTAPASLGDRAPALAAGRWSLPAADPTAGPWAMAIDPQDAWTLVMSGLTMPSPPRAVRKAHCSKLAGCAPSDVASTCTQIGAQGFRGTHSTAIRLGAGFQHTVKQLRPVGPGLASRRPTRFGPRTALVFASRRLAASLLSVTKVRKGHRRPLGQAALLAAMGGRAGRRMSPFSATSTPRSAASG